MALVVDDKGKIRANPQTGEVLDKEKPAETTAVSPVTTESGGGSAINSLVDVMNNIINDAKQSVESTKRKFIAPSNGTQRTTAVTSSPPVGVANSSGTSGFAPKTSIDKAVKDKVLFPSYGSDDDTNSKYEDYFRESGMSDDEIDKIDSRGSWMDIHKDNPATAAVTDGFDGFVWENPYVNMDINSLSDDFDEAINSLRITGNLPDHEIPSKYRSNTSSTIGNTYLVDNGKTMDYDHLTAPWATGEAMQNYGDLGMGGRSWWDYDPYAIYLKSDEAGDYGFVPYLPDETARANNLMTNMMDAPGDLAGALGSARELISASTGNGYKILYDQDGNPDTDDNLVIDGPDYDYHKDALFRHNMDHLASTAPETFMTEPENMQIHGAPVSVIVRERELDDMYGNTRYVHGDPTSIRTNTTLHIGFNDGTSTDIDQDKWLPWWNEDSKKLNIPDSIRYSNGGIDGDQVYTNDAVVQMSFPDNQTVDITPETYDSWFDENGKYKVDDNGDTIFPVGSYVSLDSAKGDLPEDLDSMNEYYMQPENRSEWTNAPVLYMPDMVMTDGTRLNWEQFNNIYDDTGFDDNPNTTSDDRVSYDYNMLNQPRRLMPGNGQMFNDDLSVNFGNFVPSTIDMTLNSLPIAFSSIGWPLSVARSLSKSMAGINPGRYNPLTSSDQYMSAEAVDGSVMPTDTDMERLTNVAGNMLVPLTEQLAGPVSGHSLIESLSGELPVNPTLAQIAKAYALGALGEGIEEIPGNVVDEVTEFANGAYGDVVTPEGERLLNDDGTPVTNPDGTYRFINPVTGRPYKYMTDQVGHIYKDPDTPMNRRLSNWLDPADMLNALAGGALVTTGMGLGQDVLHPVSNVLNSVSGNRIPVIPGHYLTQVPNAIRSNNFRKQHGLRQYVTPDEVAPEDRIRPTEEQLRMFEE